MGKPVTGYKIQTSIVPFCGEITLWHSMKTKLWNIGLFHVKLHIKPFQHPSFFLFFTRQRCRSVEHLNSVLCKDNIWLLSGEFIFYFMFSFVLILLLYSTQLCKMCFKETGVMKPMQKGMIVERLNKVLLASSEANEGVDTVRWWLTYSVYNSSFNFRWTFLWNFDFKPKL